MKPFSITLFISSCNPTVIHPVQLRKKAFHYPYRPPPPPKPGQRRQPEEVELEIKTMEENMERMALVNIE